MVVESLKPHESYKYMGVPQSTKNEINQLQEKLLIVVKQRTHIVWSSSLSDYNKVMASNIFVNSSISYYFWTLKFTIEFLQAVDRCIRETINILGGKHTNIMNAVLYTPRSKGGRGLNSVERMYKETKIKAAVKLIQNTDGRMALVKQFHINNYKSNSYSLFKEAKKYAVEFDIPLELDTLLDNNENSTLKSIEYSEISRELVKHRTASNINIILNSTWQGMNYKCRIQDEDVVKSYFDWFRNWKSCPTETISEFFLLFYQMLSTKCFKAIRSNEVLADTLCRLCRKRQESVKHLMNNCEILAKFTYTTRHNNALKCFVFPLLEHFGLIDKIPPWWSKVGVKPHYFNEKAKFWWDIPEYLGTENEDETKTPRPDGKIQIIEDKKIFLIEITIPWLTNRTEKFLLKETKYNSIKQQLKFDNPQYDIDQVTLVMDSFGGFDRNLRENIEKVLSDKSAVQKVITNMQKSVISSASHLSRRCKINFL